MAQIKHNDIFPIASGICTMRAWKKGVIKFYIDEGFNLAQAKEQALLNGALLDEHAKKNLVVTTGYNIVAQLCAADLTDGLTYFEIGTGTTAPAISDTSLVSSATRKAFTTRTSNGATFTGSTFFFAEDATYNIKEAGVWSGAATATLDSGTLFSRFLISYDNSGGTVDLTFDYVLTFQAA